mmetsp:Transcript_35913/g.75612  ORF Transcript_35913/g.75612 Transcript_35913/m.75612 type:complete len:923 (+) Transcript_35913:175-2943(+)
MTSAHRENNFKIKKIKKMDAGNDSHEKGASLPLPISASSSAAEAAAEPTMTRRTPLPPTTDDDATLPILSHRRTPARRERQQASSATIVKAASALLLAAGSAAVLMKSNPHTNTIDTFLATLRQHYDDSSHSPREVLQQSLKVMTGATSFTFESAELAWEKSENAFRQLRYTTPLLLQEEDDERRRNHHGNGFGRALEGLLDGLLRRNNNKSSHNNGHNSNNNQNLRKKEGKNNTNNGNNNSSSNSSIKQQQQQQQQNLSRNLKKETNTNKEHPTQQHQHRRNAAAKMDSSSAQVTEVEALTKPGMGGGSEEQIINNNNNNEAPLLLAPLLGFCAILFMVASFVANTVRRRLPHEQRTVLDDTEAEIVEFYERAECGTLQTIPFLQDVDDLFDRGLEGEKREPRESIPRRMTRHPLKRSGSERIRSLSLGGGGDPSMMTTKTTASSRNSSLSLSNHVRSASDPSLSLMRQRSMIHHVDEHDEEKEEEDDNERILTARESSQCDLYYSRVLETLHYEDDDDDDEVDSLGEGQQLQEGVQGGAPRMDLEGEEEAGHDQECARITAPLLEDNSSSLLPVHNSNHGPIHVLGNVAESSDAIRMGSASVPQAADFIALDTMDTNESFASAQSKLGEEEGENNESNNNNNEDHRLRSRPQSPPSTNSSISSLTSEGYDIEAPFESSGGDLGHPEDTRRQMRQGDANGRKASSFPSSPPLQVSMPIILPMVAQEVPVENSNELSLYLSDHNREPVVPTKINYDDTPKRSNVDCPPQPRNSTGSIHKQTNEPPKQQQHPTTPLPRRVSFSPEVKVCTIPTREEEEEEDDDRDMEHAIIQYYSVRQGQYHGRRYHPHRNSSSASSSSNSSSSALLSVESYLYVMLFIVAVAIAVFSFLPPPPLNLSKGMMTAGDIYERAESLLSSQWDVEL